MIDRELLQDMGFVQRDWPGGETWVLGECVFVVYFSGYKDGVTRMGPNAICATATRREFFQKFIQAIADQVMDCAYIDFGFTGRPHEIEVE